MLQSSAVKHASSDRLPALYDVQDREEVHSLEEIRSLAPGMGELELAMAVGRFRRAVETATLFKAIQDGQVMLRPGAFGVSV